jgi:hypothetical protein
MVNPYLVANVVIHTAYLTTAGVATGTSVAAAMHRAFPKSDPAALGCLFLLCGLGGAFAADVFGAHVIVPALQRVVAKYKPQ